MHSLPGTMSYIDSTILGTQVTWAHVEYALVATSGAGTATYPICLRKASTPMPIVDHEIRGLGPSKLTVVTSLRLLPEYSNTEMIFGQRSIAVFRPTRMPRYSFAVNVEYPSVIQLEHPKPMSFNIFVAPHLDPFEITACLDHDLSTRPPIQVASIRLILKSDFGTRIKHALFNPNQLVHHEKFRLSLPTYISPITIPSISQVRDPATRQEVFTSELLSPSNSLPAARSPLSANGTASFNPNATIVASEARAAETSTDACTASRSPFTPVENTAEALHEQKLPIEPKPLDLGAHLLSSSATPLAFRAAVLRASIKFITPFPHTMFMRIIAWRGK